MIRYVREGENVASRHVWPASENAAREIREVAVKNTVCDSVPVECRPKPSVLPAKVRSNECDVLFSTWAS